MSRKAVRARSSALFFSSTFQVKRKWDGAPVEVPEPLCTNPYTNRGVHCESRLRFVDVSDGGIHAQARLLGVRFLLHLAQKLLWGQDMGQGASLAIFHGSIREIEEVPV